MVIWNILFHQVCFSFHFISFHYIFFYFYYIYSFFFFHNKKKKGHAWGSTFAWLYLAFHFRNHPKFGWFLPYVAVLIIFMTALSRTYFAVHFAHDVLAGCSLGFFTFLVRDSLLLFPDSENQENNSKPNQRKVRVIQWLIVILSTLVAEFSFDQIHRIKQLGIYFALGAWCSTIALQDFVNPFHDHSKSYWKLFGRFIIGVIPIAISGPFTFRVTKEMPWSRSLDVYLFCLGFLMMLWVLFVPILFHKLKLGTLDSQQTLRKSWQKQGQLKLT